MLKMMPTGSVRASMSDVDMRLYRSTLQSHTLVLVHDRRISLFPKRFRYQG